MGFQKKHVSGGSEVPIFFYRRVSREPPLKDFHLNYNFFFLNYRRESEFIHRPCSYRTVPYRFPRGTVLVDRAAYRPFLTVFRDFCLKARTLPRFKFYRSSVLTLIFRKSANRTVPKH
jgi:hypothetical protein